MQRVRLGSRLLAYLPLRITDELVGILKEFKEKASAIGVSQFIIQTHFQSPLEVTPEAKRAIKAILDAGWVITNQLVLYGCSFPARTYCQIAADANSVGVICYYTFSVKGFNENYAVFTRTAVRFRNNMKKRFLAWFPKINSPNWMILSPINAR